MKARHNGAIIDTTVGKLIFNSFLPRSTRLPKQDNEQEGALQLGQ
jgi:hypothetical protein